MENHADQRAFYKALGQVLQAARHDRGIEADAAASYCGIGKQALLDAENGEQALPLYTLYQLSVLLDYSLPQLMKTVLAQIVPPDGSVETGMENASFDRATQEAGELMRRFLHLEGPARGDKFRQLIAELKKDK